MCMSGKVVLDDVLLCSGVVCGVVWSGVVICRIIFRSLLTPSLCHSFIPREYYYVLLCTSSLLLYFQLCTSCHVCVWSPVSLLPL